MKWLFALSVAMITSTIIAQEPPTALRIFVGASYPPIFTSSEPYGSLDYVINSYNHSRTLLYHTAHSPSSPTSEVGLHFGILLHTKGKPETEPGNYNATEYGLDYQTFTFETLQQYSDTTGSGELRVRFNQHRVNLRVGMVFGVNRHKFTLGARLSYIARQTQTIEYFENDGNPNTRPYSKENLGPPSKLLFFFYLRYAYTFKHFEVFSYLDLSFLAVDTHSGILSTGARYGYWVPNISLGVSYDLLSI